MAKLGIVCLLSLYLSHLPTTSAGAGVGANGACNTVNPSDFCNAAVLECIGGLCKIKADGDCSTFTTACLDNADCTGTPKKCVCTNNYRANAAKDTCNPTINVGGDCSSNTDGCIANALCSGSPKKCACKDNYKANNSNDMCALNASAQKEDACDGTGTVDKTCVVGLQCDSGKCLESAAIDITVSLILMTATFVTSLFL